MLSLIATHRVADIAFGRVRYGSFDAHLSRILDRVGRFVPVIVVAPAGKAVCRIDARSMSGTVMFA